MRWLFLCLSTVSSDQRRRQLRFYRGLSWIPVKTELALCGYEGDIHFSWGNISAAEMVHRFGCAYCTGAFATHGATYLPEDDVLWWSKGRKLSASLTEMENDAGALMDKLFADTAGKRYLSNITEYTAREELT